MSPFASTGAGPKNIVCGLSAKVSAPPSGTTLLAQNVLCALRGEPLESYAPQPRALALISTIEPLWTIVFGALLLGEGLTPVQVAGGAMIMAGVLVAQSARPATEQELVPTLVRRRRACPRQHASNPG